MKKTIKVLAIALVAIIGLSMAGCDDGSGGPGGGGGGGGSGLSGTYYLNADTFITFRTDGTLTLTNPNGSFLGTYKRSGSNLTITIPSAGVTVSFTIVDSNTIRDSEGDQWTKSGGGGGGGATKQFWSQEMTNNSFYRLNAQLLAEGTYCKIWVETGNSRANASTARAMADNFDRNIYPKMKPVFSIDRISFAGYTFKDSMDLADSIGDEDGKLSILLLDIRDGYNGQSKTEFVAGYFAFRDLFDNGSLGSDVKSNGMDMIYLDTYPSTPGSADSNSTLAHEMQHMINFVHDVALRNLLDGGVLTDTWLNEGLSSAAEYVYSGTPNTNRIEWYNQATAANDSRIIYGNNFLMWDDGNGSVLDDYATVNLFFQWLRLQSGGNNNIYKTISGSTSSNYRAVVNAINGYSDWETLLKTWLAANYINAPSGPYGYRNDSVLKNVKARTVPSGTRSVNLYPGEGVYSVTNSSGYTPNSGGNIRYAGLNTSSGSISDYDTFASGALLTYNISTNLEGQRESGATTGIAASVQTTSDSLSARALFARPFQISAGEMLKRNGHEEVTPPLLRLKLGGKDN